MHSAITPESLVNLVVKLMKELHPEAASHQEITLDSSLDRDLGLDSLARMELLVRLEKKYGSRLPEKILAYAETPRDLLRHLTHTSREKITEPVTKGMPQAKPGERLEAGFAKAGTLLEVLEQQAQLQPDTLHITLLEEDGETNITYGMLRQKAIRVAVCLRRFQLDPRETVAIMLPTGADYFYSFMGILYAGGIPVPLYPPARPAQIEEHIRRHRKIISNARASILITIPEVRPVARLLMGQVPELKRILTVEELYDDQPENIPMQCSSGDIAFLQYTSGSTGDPKGVVLSHQNLLTNIRVMGQVCQVTTRDVFISWLPLYHDMGLIGAWFGSLCHGCRLVVMSPLSFLARPVRWLRAIERYGGTLSASPNFGYELCNTRLDEAELEGLDLHSWRMAFNGAEPVIPKTMRRFQERFEPYGLQRGALAPVYGLAETTVGLAFPNPGSGVICDRVVREIFVSMGKAEPAGDQDDSALEFISCGKPLPAHQIRIIDGQGRELPERRQGRLQFKGPSATSGYFRNAEETGKLFVGEWLDSGDLAYIAAGNVYITSRQKDMIIRGGRNIYPHELEEAVNTIPGIRKGCTAVFASTSKGDTTEKLVVLTETRKTKESELQELKRQIKMVSMDLLTIVPDDVVIAKPGTVLKTSSGKIRRAACRKFYEKGLLGRPKAAVWLQLIRMALASVKPLLRRLGERVASVVYASYCWLLLGFTGALVWCGLMVLPAGEKGWQLASRAVRLLCRLMGIGIKLTGVENIPLGRQYLLVSNHMSYLDSIILTGILPEPCNFVAKAELAGNPLLKAALEKLEVFFVDRFDAGQGVEDTRKIDEGVQHGKKPIFFAEGTLQRMPGLLPFQMGAFVLASRKELPVVPVIIQGTRNMLRSGSWFPRRGVVHVSFAPSCQTVGKEWEDAVELRNHVRKAMLARLDEPDLAGEYSSLLQMEIERPKLKDEV